MVRDIKYEDVKQNERTSSQQVPYSQKYFYFFFSFFKIQG